MKKRLLTLTAITCLSLALACPGTALAKSYDLVSNLTQTSFQGKLTLNLVKDIENATSGKITFNWHDAGDLIPVNMHLTSVSTGAVPAAMTWLGYFSGTVPSTKFFAGYPFAPKAEHWLTWMFDGEGYDLLQESMAPLNIVALPCFFFPAETGGFFKKAVTKPEDFQGLRFRIGGWGGDVAAKLGAVVNQIPGNELYLAMERGRIDAMEFSSPVVDESWGFQKVSDYYYFPGWHNTGAWNHLLINKKVWDSFTDLEREQIQIACRSFLLRCLTDVNAKQVDALERIKSGSNIKVERLSDEIILALYAAWKEVLAEDLAKYPDIKKAYESLDAHVKKMAEYDALQDMSIVEGK